MANDAGSGWKRSHYAILILASLSTFGTNYVHDMLTVLQPVITGRVSCNKFGNNTDCCRDCLSLDDRDYNLIYTELFLTCAVSLLVSGYLLDKFGNWILIVLVSLTVIGASITAMAACLRGTAAVKPLMFLGCFIRGAGFLTSLVARNRLLASWFLGKEIGFAYGTASAINRLGTVPCYMLTEVIREAVGLPVTLWIGVLISMLSVLCAIGAVLVDSTSRCSTHIREIDAEGRKAMSIRDVIRFSAQYWVLIAIIGFYSGVFRSTQDNATEMINEKFGLRKTIAAIVAGVMLYMSIVLSPLIGLISDKLGRKGYGILFGSLVHIPALSLLAFTGLTPVIGCVMLGLGFCCFTSILMSSVPLLVDRNCVGMAVALAQLSSTVCTAGIHVALSEILGRFNGASVPEKQQRWQLSLSFILCVAIVAVALTISLLALSLRSNGVLTRKAGPASEEEKPVIDKQENGDAQNEKTGSANQ